MANGRVPPLVLAAISSLKLLHQYGQHKFIPVLELAKACYQAKDEMGVFVVVPCPKSVVGLSLGVCGLSHLLL